MHFSGLSLKSVRKTVDVLSVVSSHVETVVCLNNKNSKSKDYVEIGIDAEDYYKIKDSKKE